MKDECDCRRLKDTRSKVCALCLSENKPMVCRIPACGRPVRNKINQLCNRHYLRLRRHGDPLAGSYFRSALSVGERFTQKLSIGEVSSDGYTRHLLFETVTNGGYGDLFVASGKPTIRVFAHRYAWEKWIGPIPEGYDIDHWPECPKNCVNPAHLQALSHSDHTKLGYERGETGARKLTELQETSIQTRYGQGGITQQKLADEFGVGIATICRTIGGR